MARCLAVVEAVVAACRLRCAALLRLLLLVIRILLAELLLRRGDQPEIMFGVLVVIFGGDRVSGALRVTRELDVFLGDLLSGAADFHVRAVRLVNSRERILAFAVMVVVTSPHPLVTVSHGAVR